MRELSMKEEKQHSKDLSRLANDQQQIEELLEENETLSRQVMSLKTELASQVQEKERLRETLNEFERKEDNDISALVKKLAELKELVKIEREEKQKIQRERDTMHNELEELSRSLFEESYRLVSDEAKKRAQSDQDRKKLEEELHQAKMCLEVEGQMTHYLKNRLHFISNTKRLGRSQSGLVPEHRMEESIPGPKENGVTPKLQIRPSRSEISLRHNSLPIFDQISEEEITEIPEGPDESKFTVSLSQDCSPIVWKEFCEFVAVKNVKNVLSGPFGERILKVDIEPCLRFPRTTRWKWMSHKGESLKELETALASNRCVIEPHKGAGECSLCWAISSDWNMWIIREGKEKEGKEKWEDGKAICRGCRERMVAVRELYCWLTHLRDGLIRDPLPSLFRHCQRLRLQLHLSRLCAG